MMNDELLFSEVFLVTTVLEKTSCKMVGRMATSDSWWYLAILARGNSDLR